MSPAVSALRKARHAAKRAAWWTGQSHATAAQDARYCATRAASFGFHARPDLRMEAGPETFESELLGRVTIPEE